MNKINILIENNKIIIIGFITFDNVVDVLNECIEKSKNITEIEIDFKKVYNSNSSVLLFIINYIKYTIQTNKKVFFINISKLLLDLSKVYNLNKLIIKLTKKDKNETNINQ